MDESTITESPKRVNSSCNQGRIEAKAPVWRRGCFFLFLAAPGSLYRGWMRDGAIPSIFSYEGQRGRIFAIGVSIIGKEEKAQHALRAFSYS